MDTQYKEALSLYNQCEYEKAYDILSNSVTDFGKKGHLLLEECKKQILQQYVSLINEAEKQKDISEANRLKAMYVEKFGKNSLISEPQHDNKLFILAPIVVLFICCFILWIMSLIFDLL